MELVDTGGSSAAAAAAHDVPKCLYSVKVSLDKDCKLSLESLAPGGGVFVDALWGSEAAKTYKQYTECPSASAAPVPATGSSATQIKAALLSAINKFPYSGEKDFTLGAIVIAGGVVTVTDVAETPPPNEVLAALQFVYAIREVGRCCLQLLLMADACCASAASLPLLKFATLPCPAAGHRQHCWCCGRHLEHRPARQHLCDSRWCRLCRRHPRPLRPRPERRPQALRPVPGRHLRRRQRLHGLPRRRAVWCWPKSVLQLRRRHLRSRG